MSKMLEIRREYGESFVDVVKGFAAQRMSKRLTAKTLNINLPYFRELLTRFDLHKYFYPRGKQSERRPGCKNIHRWEPITHNGITWYPGESTHHFLREQRTR